ncbi:MAG: hypothetical protein K6F32_01190, partial [Bacilli bacterium]|nr:hypothetical protein [Bacilli bacterium]
GASEEPIASSEEEISSEPEAGWTAEEKAIFDEHFYGVELPYPAFEVAIAYDEEEDSIMGASTSADLTLDDLYDYSYLFSEDDGWAEEESGQDGVILFELTLETDDGTRFPSVTMALLDADGYVVTAEDEPGTVTFFASDPYIYDWQTETIAAIVDYIAEGSETVVPAYETDVKYYIIGTSHLIDSGYASVACFTSDENPVASYSAVLTEAGWTVSTEANSYGYYEAISPNEDIMLEFYHLTSQGALVIFIEGYTAPVLTWPAEGVAEVVQILAPGSETVVPGIEGATNYFLNTDYLADYGYAGVICYGADTLLAAYSAALTAAGWEVTDAPNADGYYCGYSPAQDIMVEFNYRETAGALVVFVEGYVEPVPAVWPAEDAAAMLDLIVPGTETVLPELDGGTAYAVLDPLYVAYFGYGYVEVYGPETLTATYAAILTEAGWILEEGVYTSPNGDVCVILQYDAEYGELLIVVQAPAITEWPAEDAAAIVEAVAPGSTTVIPAFEGADSYDVYIDADEAAVYGTGEIDLLGTAEDVEAFAAVLTEAGWTVNNESEEDGYVEAISPNEDIFVTITYNTRYELIEYVITAYAPASTTWPAEDIAELLGDKVTDTIPAYEGESSGYLATEDAWGKMIVVNVEEGTEEAAITAYGATLVEAGWTANENGTFTSPNGQITISLYMGTSGSFTIDFTVDPWLDALDAFPLDAVNTFLTDESFGFTLSEALTDPSEKGFKYESGASGYGYNYARVEVSGNVLDAWDEALSATLIAAGFELDAAYSTDTYKVYYNAATDMEVDIRYVASSDTTYIAFFGA